MQVLVRSRVFAGTSLEFERLDFRPAPMAHQETASHRCAEIACGLALDHAGWPTASFALNRIKYS